jgi:hypothetical protein
MKTLIKIISLQLLFLINVIGQNQDNLVLNPSFESVEGKLKKINSNQCSQRLEFSNCIESRSFFKK